MLKIITSVVLSLVTIMAVTLFAVTVPAQAQKIDENAAAIVKAQTDAETNAYNKVKEDILSDMSGSTLEDVGTAISLLQDDVATLEDKHLYYHPISVFKSYEYTFSFVIINNYSTAYTKTSIIDAIKGFSRISPLNGSIIINTKILNLSYARWEGEAQAHFIVGVFNDGTVATVQDEISLEAFISGASYVSDDINILL